MHRSRLGFALAAVSALASGAGAAPATGRFIFLATDDFLVSSKLYRVDPAATDVIEATIAVTGLQGAELLRSIAIQPTTGALYAYTDQYRLYQVNKTSGAATEVGAQNAGLPAGPSGNVCWIRFDPVSGELRWTNRNGVNVRIDPASNATIATETAYAIGAGDVYFGTTSTVTGLAFSNSHDAATATQLFTTLQPAAILAKVANAAAGTLQSIGFTGYTCGGVGGFVCDLDGTFYLAVETSWVGIDGPVGEIYRIDPSTAHATFIGPLGSTPLFPYDLAIDYDPTSPDLDSDGFSNVIEVAAGADPRTPASTPFGGALDAADPEAAPSIAGKLKVDLRFDQPLRDALLLKGSFHVDPALPFERAGMRIIADAGGVIHVFDLDGKGKATSSGGARIKVSKPSGAGTVKYQLKWKHASFAADLADEGLVDATLSGAALTIEVDLYFIDRLLETSRGVTYDAVAGVFGKARS